MTISEVIAEIELRAADRRYVDIHEYAFLCWIARELRRIQEAGE